MSVTTCIHVYCYCRSTWLHLCKVNFNFSLYSLSSCSERFCAITAIDLLEKVNLIPKRSSKVIVQRDSRVSNHSGQSLTLSFSDIEQQETSIEKLAYRFNQVYTELISNAYNKSVIASVFTLIIYTNIGRIRILLLARILIFLFCQCWCNKNEYMYAS